jgi:hypothetical protein
LSGGRVLNNWSLILRQRFYRLASLECLIAGIPDANIRTSATIDKVNTFTTKDLVVTGTGENAIVA